ncbi:C4-dicarboxylate transport sensor protein DctB [Roseibaca ekhonensis]|uniref:C4-dicarboxylate transport sensor protein DctB n=2 Tax=Roseinatronobacter ekhonensis TaxID=254356 RepID=A0A3B0M6D8_9RHOB|nr:C4-dicarboxylate transport sensor protein DctB [Roseibaca ekhonensis]
MSAGGNRNIVARMITPPDLDNRRASILGIPLWGRAAVFALVVVAAVSTWFLNGWLSTNFTEATRNRAELRLVLYSGNIQSELQRNSVVPLLLARDPVIADALRDSNFATISQRLIDLQNEIGAASIELLDQNGRTVGATDRNILGTMRSSDAVFVDARRTPDTVFQTRELDSGGFSFTFSRAVRSGREVLGVVIVSADLSKFERSWAGFADAVALMESSGRIVLATEPRWRGRSLEEALAIRDAPSAIARAFRATTDWTQPAPDAFLRGEAVLRSEVRVPFRGWKLVSFTRYDSVRERVNAALALVLTGFALLLALTFYILSRRAYTQSEVFKRESEELRGLNARLQREIAARVRMQKDLAVAEQTLAQSSKLASLGEMSASVSHELNQPLAAMKTYLAGARLLLKRKRPEEALASFQRIDDLIDRMGAIARTLKSFARKGGEAFAPIDLRTCVADALTMTEPLLRDSRVLLVRTVPPDPVMILGDSVRVEQVILNLVRNAVDATKNTNAPQIDIILSQGDTAKLTVRDNGEGIADIDNLFEPFYTTKPAGQGVGLGLAISSGIVKDHGGRLTALNPGEGGAVFEVEFPRYTGSDQQDT